MRSWIEEEKNMAFFFADNIQVVPKYLNSKYLFIIEWKIMGIITIKIQIFYIQCFDN